MNRGGVREHVDGRIQRSGFIRQHVEGWMVEGSGSTERGGAERAGAGAIIVVGQCARLLCDREGGHVTLRCRDPKVDLSLS